MSQFDITVVIPTFNAEKSIQRCLESLQTQLGVTLEVIVIDGGSSDGTVPIVERLAPVGTTVVSEPDRGIYDAINKGVLRARGALIGVLGADDIYRAGVLAVAKNHALGGKEIIAGLTLVDNQLRKDEPYGDAALLSGIPFGHNAMFASQQAYREVGLYDLEYRICADAEWVHRAIKNNIPCRKVEEIFVEFGTEGTSSTNPEKVMSEAYSVIQRNFPFLSRTDAKVLLYAVRRWQDATAVNDILRSHRHADPLFVRAVLEAFPHLKDDPAGHNELRYLASVAKRLSGIFARSIGKK